MANFDPNTWYHVSYNGKTTNALYGTNLFNKASVKGPGGAVFMKTTNETDEGQYWQFYAVDSEYYILRSKGGGSAAVLGTMYSPMEKIPGKTRPRTSPADKDDDSIYWKISPWGDGTFFLTNKANKTEWHMARNQDDTGLAMNSDIQNIPPSQRWSFESWNKTIDNRAYSSVSFLPASSTAPSSSSTAAPEPKSDVSSTTAPPASPTNNPSSEPGRPSTETNSTGLSTTTQVAIGVSIGLVALIALVVLGLFLWRKRRRNPNPNPQIPELAHSTDYKHAYEADSDSLKHEVDGGQKYEMDSRLQRVELAYTPRPTELALNMPPAELPNSPLQRP